MKTLRNMITKRDQGVTIIEILIVLIIVSILASIAIPSFGSVVARTNGERAINNIEMIISAWKINNMKNAGYVFYNNALTNNNYLIQINRDLNLYITDDYFIYGICKIESIYVGEIDPNKNQDVYIFYATAKKGTYAGTSILYAYYKKTQEEYWNDDISPRPWPWHPVAS